MSALDDHAERDIRPAYRGARVLITGGAGFIAGHLASELLRLGAEVVLVDEHARLSDALAPTAPLHLLGVGTSPFADFLGAAGPFDYLFHLAARAYAADSVNAPVADFEANLVATMRLLEQLRTLGAHTRLVFASSAAVYGNPLALPVTEEQPTVPISPYGVSKLAAERYVAVYAHLYGIPAASLRLFSVYGPGQRKQVVYDLLAKLRASPAELEVLGDGSQVRDLVYVADVAHAFAVVGACGRLDGSVYNVASGTGTSTAELAQLIVEVQEQPAAIRFTGSTRPGDPERWVGAAARLAALQGAPTWSLRDGLRSTASWFNGTAAGAPARRSEVRA